VEEGGREGDLPFGLVCPVRSFREKGGKKGKGGGGGGGEGRESVPALFLAKGTT